MRHSAVSRSKLWAMRGGNPTRLRAGRDGCRCGCHASAREPPTRHRPAGRHPDQRSNREGDSRLRSGGKSCGWPELLVTISFTSRVAIPNSRSRYEINMYFTPTGPCSHGHNDGLGARTTGDLRAGQRAHVTVGISNCPGAVRGDVVYNGNTGAHTNQGCRDGRYWARTTDRGSRRVT
jgi:hypothetical protein